MAQDCKIQGGGSGPVKVHNACASCALRETQVTRASAKLNPWPSQIRSRCKSSSLVMSDDQRFMTTDNKIVRVFTMYWINSRTARKPLISVTPHEVVAEKLETQRKRYEGENVRCAHDHSRLVAEEGHRDADRYNDGHFLPT